MRNTEDGHSQPFNQDGIVLAAELIVDRAYPREKIRKAAISVGRCVFNGLIANSGYAALELASRPNPAPNESDNY